LSHSRENEASNLGFTLIEILVSLVIASAVLAAVFQLASVSLKGTSRAEHYMGATELAQNLLIEVGVVRPLESGVSEGETRPYLWLITISERPDESDLNMALRLYDVSCEVKWGGGLTGRSVTLKTVRSTAR
jgi:type II secretion system protein I